MMPSGILKLNPNGIQSLSPGLRGTSYPGCRAKEESQPQRGCSQCRAIRCNPVGVEDNCIVYPGWLVPRNPGL